MKSLKHYFQKAYAEKFAIGQFNFSDWSQVKGIVAAAQQLKSPIILGTSEGESKFVGLQEAVAVRNVLRKKTGLPIFLNLDHGKSADYLKEAITAGYDMVHFDGSKLPLDENIKISKDVFKFAKWRGVVVEGEVGRFGTDASKVYTEKFEIKEEDLTKVDEAVRYLKETGADILAVSVGTFHGVDASGQSPHLKLDMLGISKININTDTRLAFANALKKALGEPNAEITPYKYLAGPIEAVRVLIEEKIRLFGSENRV